MTTCGVLNCESNDFLWLAMSFTVIPCCLRHAPLKQMPNPRFGFQVVNRFLVHFRGFWGNKIGKPHTVPCKVTGKCGSIWVRLIPAPRGTGIVSAPVPKKLLQMAGIEDCYTSARGSTGTLGNFGKFDILNYIFATDT